MPISLARVKRFNWKVETLCLENTATKIATKHYVNLLWSKLPAIIRFIEKMQLMPRIAYGTTENKAAIFVVKVSLMIKIYVVRKLFCMEQKILNINFLC